MYVQMLRSKYHMALFPAIQCKTQLQLQTQVLKYQKRNMMILSQNGSTSLLSTDHSHTHTHTHTHSFSSTDNHFQLRYPFGLFDTRSTPKLEELQKKLEEHMYIITKRCFKLKENKVQAGTLPISSSIQPIYKYYSITLFLW